MLRKLAVLPLLFLGSLLASAQCTVSYVDNPIAEATLNTFDSTGTIPGAALPYFVENPQGDPSCGSWTAASDSPWVTLPNASSGSTGGVQVAYSVAANSGGPRTAII